MLVRNYKAQADSRRLSPFYMCFTAEYRVLRDSTSMLPRVVLDGEQIVVIGRFSYLGRCVMKDGIRGEHSYIQGSSGVRCTEALVLIRYFNTIEKSCDVHGAFKSQHRCR